MREKLKSIIYFLVGGVSVVYLILPSVLPDAIPFIGALDEITATLLLVASFKHFGIDLTELLLFRKGLKK